MPQMVNNKLLNYLSQHAFILSVTWKTSFMPDKRQTIVQFLTFRYVFTQHIARHDAELRVIMHFLYLFFSLILCTNTIFISLCHSQTLELHHTL
jgi:hypothetical protein